MLALDMRPAQHVLLASVFLGGCLTGGALLNLSAGQAEPSLAVQPKAPRPRPKLATLPVGVSDDAVVQSIEPPERPHDGDVSDAEPADAEPTLRSNEPSLGPGPADATSAADVLVQLEQAYQRQLAERDEPVAETSPEAGASHAEPRELAVAVVSEQHGPDAEVSVRSEDTGPSVKRIEVELSQVETHHTEVNQGNVHEGDVHIGDVNQIAVNQVAVLAYPVYVVPPESLPTTSKLRPPPTTTRIPRTDPWAPIYYSPRHNPWGRTFGRRP